jgi:hypothetical protein
VKVKPKGSAPGTIADYDDIIDALTSLRERQLVPWQWIVDETRFVDNYTGYPDLATGLLTGEVSMGSVRSEKKPA